MSGFARLMHAETEVLRAQEAYSHGATHLQLSRMRRNMAFLLSQHEPVKSLGIDRDRLRLALEFIEHGDEKRCARDLVEQLEKEKTE